jgi:hypothetical protein
VTEDQEALEALRELGGAAVEMATYLHQQHGDDVVTIPGWERWRTADAEMRRVLMRRPQ